MSDEKKDLARRNIEEVWGAYNPDIIEKYHAANYIDHNQLPGLPEGLEGLKLTVSLLGKAFSNTHLVIEDQIAEGNTVVSRWSWTGTHTGDLLGIPATGKQVMNTGIRIDRFEGSKIVESWSENNAMGLMQQLGVVPMPGE